MQDVIILYHFALWLISLLILVFTLTSLAGRELPAGLVIFINDYEKKQVIDCLQMYNTSVIDCRCGLVTQIGPSNWRVR